jgi:DNA-binding IclR family transcriptional regulator
VRFRIPEVEKSGGAQTVDRALEVLKIVVREGRPLLLEDLATRAGFGRSITYRLVRSLENAGLIRREAAGGYTVGAALLSMSVQTASRIDLRRAARPTMEAIVALHGETASLHIRSGEQRVCVEVVEGTHPIRRMIPIGETLPLFAGETGRVLLSELGEADVAPFLEAASVAGLDIERLRADLLRIREQGYFIGIGERTPGVGSISLPIYGSVGVLGALTVSGPVNRWSRAAMKAALPSILDLVQPVSIGLGGQTTIPRSLHA